MLDTVHVLVKHLIVCCFALLVSGCSCQVGSRSLSSKTEAKAGGVECQSFKVRNLRNKNSDRNRMTF